MKITPCDKLSLSRQDGAAELLTITLAICDLHKVMELSGQLFKVNEMVLYHTDYLFLWSISLSGKVFKISLKGFIGWESC